MLPPWTKNYCFHHLHKAEGVASGFFVLLCVHPAHKYLPPPSTQNTVIWHIFLLKNLFLLHPPPNNSAASRDNCWAPEKLKWRRRRKHAGSGAHLSSLFFLFLFPHASRMKKKRQPYSTQLARKRNKRGKSGKIANCKFDKTKKKIM